MTSLPNLSEQPIPRVAARKRLGMQLLGVGVFVSVYIHVAFVPAVSGIVDSEPVGLFAPTRNRASVELTMSMPSRANQASAEVAMRLDPGPRTPLEADRVPKTREALTSNEISAAPTTLTRPEESSASFVSLPREADAAASASAYEPSSAERPAPRPLDRRQEEAAPRSGELQGETYTPPRAATADSPAQIASSVRLGAEAENLPEHVLNPPPIYPTEALKAGVEGTTIVAATISRTGSVIRTSIAGSSGSALLDRAAEQAVRQWTFRPALRYGLAVEMTVGVPVTFSIREALAAEGERTTPPDPRTP